MSEIKIQCVDQALHLVEMPPIYSGDVNYDTVSFDFDTTWNDYTKTAIFYQSKDKAYSQLLDASGSCKIPKEVLASKGICYIGVFGVYDNTVITSQVLRYRILEGAITEDLNIPDPTPSIYEQILSKYNYLIERVIYDLDGGEPV